MGVYIIGRGVVSPAGTGLQNHIDQMFRGLDPLSELSRDGVAVLPESTLQKIELLRKEKQNLRKLDRSVLLAILASQEAIDESELLPSDAAVIFGSSRGATETLEVLCRATDDRQRI